MKKILITGGFGYLGGRLAQFLASQTDYEILLGSRNQTQAPTWLPQAQVVQTGWDSPSELEKICAGVDAVIHSAGMNAQDCANNPSEALKVNSEYTKTLLQAAIKQKVKRFIYLSTAHVYGNPLIGKITESSPTLGTHPYATSHLAGEKHILEANERNDIEGVVIRLSNAFGAPTHKEVNCWMLLVNDLCRQATSTQKMILKSSGMQRRDFITLTDACRAIKHLLELPADKLGDGLFNVGGDWSPTVWEMTCLIQERCRIIIGFKPEIVQPKLTNNKNYFILNYNTDKLLSKKFTLESLKKEEIDNTLNFFLRNKN